jgi:hypothetical protein
MFRMILAANNDYFRKHNYVVIFVMETQCTSCQIGTEFVPII